MGPGLKPSGAHTSTLVLKFRVCQEAIAKGLKL